MPSEFHREQRLAYQHGPEGSGSDQPKNRETGTRGALNKLHQNTESLNRVRAIPVTLTPQNMGIETKGAKRQSLTFLPDECVIRGPVLGEMSRPDARSCDAIFTPRQNLTEKVYCGNTLIYDPLANIKNEVETPKKSEVRQEERREQKNPEPRKVKEKPEVQSKAVPNKQTTPPEIKPEKQKEKEVPDKTALEWKSGVTIRRTAKGEIYAGTSDVPLKPNDQGAYLISKDGKDFYFKIIASTAQPLSIFSCDASGKMLDDYKAKSLEVAAAHLKEMFAKEHLVIADSVIKKDPSGATYEGRITWTPPPRPFVEKYENSFGNARTYDLFPVTLSINDKGFLVFQAEKITRDPESLQVLTQEPVTYRDYPDVLKAATEERNTIDTQSSIRIKNGREKKEITYTKPVLKINSDGKGRYPRFGDPHPYYVYERLVKNDGYYNDTRNNTEYFVDNGDLYFAKPVNGKLCQKIGQGIGALAYLRIDGKFIELRAKEGSAGWSRVYVSSDGNIVCDQDGVFIQPMDATKKVYRYPKKETEFFTIGTEKGATVPVRCDRDGNIL